MRDHKIFVSNLNFWSGEVDPTPLGGGITNVNFMVEDNGKKFVVRVGEDIPLHHVMRFNELAASEAAFNVGISPEVVYHEPGILIIRFVEGKTFNNKDVQVQSNLERILPVIQRCHYDIPKSLRGPSVIFWVFHTLRDYAATINARNNAHRKLLERLLNNAEKLEAAVGQIDMVYGHNDLLPANFIDDGSKLWLIDWDYAGFNSPLFDLSGLASNNELTLKQEEWLLEAYYDKPPTDHLRYQYNAMKCASLLRETMWSMVSEIHSEINFDFANYTKKNLTNYEAAIVAFEELT